MDKELLDSIENMEISLKDIVNAIKEINIEQNNTDMDYINNEMFSFKEYLNNIDYNTKSIDSKINGYLDNIEPSDFSDYTSILEEIKSAINNISVSNTLTPEIKLDIENNFKELELKFDTEKFNSLIETLPDIDLNVNIDNIRKELSEIDINLKLDNVKSILEDIKYNITPDIEIPEINIEANIISNIDDLKKEITSLSQDFNINFNTELDFLNKDYTIDVKPILTQDIDSLINEIKNIQIDIIPNINEEENLYLNITSNIDDILNQIDTIDKEIKYSIENVSPIFNDIKEEPINNIITENIITENYFPSEISTIDNDVENITYDIEEKPIEYIKEYEDFSQDYIQEIKNNNKMLETLITLISEQKPIIIDNTINPIQEQKKEPIMNITNNTENNTTTTKDSEVLFKILNAINQLIRDNKKLSFGTNINFD